MRPYIAIFALFATPVAAQDLSFTPQATDSCLINSGHEGDKSACIGLSAVECMATPDGQTTIGMGFCLDAELAYWDDMLNSGYQALRSAMQASDAGLPTHLAIQAEQLRDMQRAWITFRDARCSYEASLWQGGTGASPAFLGCMMTVTAQQALYLMGIYSGEG